MKNKRLINKKAAELVAQMTLEEKASLCSGKDCWNLKGIKRLGLGEITVMDGPHGLRKQTGATDNLGIGDSVPAVCFPTASALACSFDKDLVYQVGKAIGQECCQEDVSVILGPAISQKRSPLCGRNFEYFSEDPVVSGELGASMIRGISSTGTGTSLKHFAVNNQEKRRMTINAVVDERAFREVYLKSFEIAVKKGKPDTVMCSYNKINGVYSSENKYLLTDILRKEWGFDGLVVSDWGAVNDRVLGIKAGMDLEMPGNEGYNDKKIIEAINSKKLTMEELNETATRVTRLILKSILQRGKGYKYDKKEHHQLAVEAEEQSAVLLKNRDNILPGTTSQKAAVIGALAKTPRYQGAGSSKIHPIYVEKPYDCLKKAGLDAEYAKGYMIAKGRKKGTATKKEQAEQQRLIKEACEIAKGKDIVYIFAGLPEGYESEGFDREDLSMPKEQNILIEEICKCNPNVAVVLMGGAPIEIPWISKVKAVLLAYLGGEGMGQAIANLLLGKKSPSGKLAETWPVILESTPSYHYFPGGRKTVEYRESIYIGYRYYEKAGIPVRFPFGHGLSYTKFSYSDLSLEKERCNYGDTIKVCFTVKNIGKVAGKETSFIFVSHNNEIVFQPKKELKEFTKVELEPGEEKRVTVSVDTSEFGYYNTLINKFYAESGSYEILVGPSLTKCPLRKVLFIDSINVPQPDYRNSAPAYYKLKKEPLVISKDEFASLYGKALPNQEERVTRPFDWNNTLEDAKVTLIGKLINKYADKIAKDATKAEEGQEGMMSAMIKEMPFFAMVTSGDGLVSESMMEGIIELLNRHYIKGIRKLLK